MSIRRHGSGYEVRIQHAGQRISRSFKRYRDATEFERRSRQRLEDHRVGRQTQYTLEEALARWLTGEAASLKSYMNLKDKVRAIQPHITGRALTEIADVAEAVIQAGQRADLKPATINRRLAILRRVARLAHRKWRWLDRDEAGRITAVSGEEARFVQATPEQMRKLLRAAKGRTRQAIQWAVLTGLRKSELLRVERHHFQNGCLVVTRNKTGKPRAVPLQRDLSASSFPWGLTTTDVEERFREARTAAGMPWLQFRDLRRTFGSWVVQKTGNLKAAQDLLGHTTPTITAAHYAHLLGNHLREAVETLPAFRVGMARGRAKGRKAA